MWLRSERRDRRLRRSNNRPSIAPSLGNLSKKSKPSRNVKVHNNNNNACAKKPGISKLSKCNITRKSPVVKRLNAVRTSSRRCRRKTIEKENIWKDGNDITLYESRSRTRRRRSHVTIPAKESSSSLGGPNDDLNTFGPIALSHCSKKRQMPASSESTVSTSTTVIGFNESVTTTEICRSQEEDCVDRNLALVQDSTANFIKCVSECDSTTDYESSGILPGSQYISYYSASAFHREQTNSSDAADSEVDSTTDLFTGQGNSSDAQSVLSASAAVEDISPTLAYNSGCNFPSSCSDLKGLSCSISQTAGNYPTTPDLISIFDEDISKSTTTTAITHTTAANSELCHYSDFLPYNTILTQALLNCTETSQMCDAHDLVNVTSASTSSYLHQTAIDNLKALTNLPTHPTSLFSTLNLPKGPGEVDSLIHSVPTFGQDPDGGSVYSKSPPEGDLHIDPDDCPEIEEMPDTRQEEMHWDTFDPYVFIKHLPPLTIEMRAKCPALPLKTRSSPEFSLVLDLDETLVHCSLQELSDASFKFPVLFQDCKYTVFVRTRPYFREFLEKVSKLFEVILFTASKRVYADKLLNLLDPERKWIKYRLFREHCILVNGNYIKDLTILGRDLSKTIIIDNSPQAFGYQLENGIPIESWFMDQSDSELMKILPFLEQLAGMREDVRPHIREKYRLFSYLPPD